MKRLVGCRFGELRVLRALAKRSRRRCVVWECECSCGVLTLADTNKLTTGRKRSCGHGRGKGRGIGGVAAPDAAEDAASAVGVAGGAGSDEGGEDGEG